jgi:NhaP-type Na+/H+ or K+/H+ antiporter
MYIELAVLALIVFGYSLIAGRLERTFLSGPIVFVFTGVMVGPLGFGFFDGDAGSANLRVLADLTLALVLFIDAASSDISVLKRQFQIPSRMLLIGLPGAIILGSGIAAIMFDVLSIYETVILGVILAATDAALGKAVISNPAVPSRIREGLNVESGLNDGLCVPILLVFIALAKGSGDGEPTPALQLIVQELGIGLAVGVSLAMAGAWLLDRCERRGWVTDVWKQLTVIGLAIACFSIAQSVHGSGYIAAFTGGMAFGYISKGATHERVLPAEAMSETLALMTWLVFGAMVVGQSLNLFTWDVVFYALLSLTIVRMLPIYLSLAGSGESISSRLFLGWFGPRGLASIVFAIIVMDAALPGSRFMSAVVVTTVILSLVAHGVSAKPLAAWLVRKEEKGAARDTA